MSDLSIEVVDLTKRYKIYKRPVDRIIDWLCPFSRKYYSDFWALRNISFTIQKGSALGIIGANGAGKSTLLKIISGTAIPTSGYAKVSGRVAALLELGMGFHSELTGRQNIKLNGRLLGLTQKELEEKTPEIIDFSELGDFIDQPLRTYSSGMYVRLGFSIVASVEPEILIIDEALSVGDVHFQQKCIRRIREIHENGATLVFVSHDPGAVTLLCKEAILLDEGEVVSRGIPDEILDHYNALITQKSAKDAIFHIKRIPHSGQLSPMRHSGNFMAIILEAGLVSDKGSRITAVVAGQRVSIYVKVFFVGEVANPTIGFVIKDRLGSEIFGTNTYMLGQELGVFSAGETLEVHFPCDFNIGIGEYTLTAAAHTLDYHFYECFDWADKIFTFSVIASTDFKFIGTAKLYPGISCRKLQTTPTEARTLIETLFKDAPSCITMAPADMKFLCKGWYQSEPTSEGYFRWTDKEFAFFLNVKGSKMGMELACPRPDIKDSPTKGRVTIQGKQVADFTVNSGEPRTIQFPLPEEHQNRISLFSICLDRSWKPSNYFESQDERELGIIVRKIWTE